MKVFIGCVERHALRCESAGVVPYASAFQPFGSKACGMLRFDKTFLKSFVDVIYVLHFISGASVIYV
ncbi:hypothetical protein DRN85_00965 [Methanosarcinales archaeon]|nr:MAG: hypothetical protein DRN85_00965 [Methanosarcinales archaeon]